MNIMICGSRSFKNFSLLEKLVLEDLQDYLIKNPEIGYLKVDETYIISGKANGADTLGEMFANKYGLKIKSYPAKWNDLNVEPCKIGYNKNNKPYNKLAGINRNIDMVNISDIVIIFHDGKSKGTANDLKLCKEKNKIYYYHRI